MLFTEKKRKKTHGETLKNIAYACKTVWQISPFYVICVFVWPLISYTYSRIFKSIVLIRELTSIIEGDGDFRRFVIYVAVFAAIGLVTPGAENFLTRFCLNKEEKVTAVMRRRLFDKAYRSDMADFENPDTFDIYQRATDTIECQKLTALIENCTRLFADLATLIYILAYVISVDPVLLLVLPCGIPLFILKNKILEISRKRSKELTTGRRKTDYANRLFYMREYAKDIRTSGISDVAEEVLDSATEANVGIRMKYARKSVWFFVAQQIFGTIIPTAGVYAYAGIKFAVKKTMKLSDFSVIISAATQLFSGITGLVSGFTDLSENSIAIDFLREYLEKEPEIKNGSEILDEIKSIEFSNVTFTYPGSESPALKNISFKIEPDETIAVVGINGAGKTTMIKLLLRFYDADSGEILINGKSIGRYDIDSLRSRISTVFQDCRVFAMTVAENVLCREPTEENAKLLESSLKAGGIYDKVQALPLKENNPLTAEIDKKGVGLSGGEQQKLAVSRMFAADYSLAILDEPSSALDAKAEYEMYRNIIENTKGKMVIYVSHRLASAAIADRILVFEKGKIIQAGTHSELLRAEGLYGEMFNLQASAYREEVSE